MKRDMDLMREILLEVEKLNSMERWVARPLMGHSKEEVVAHVRLAMDAQLVGGAVTSSLAASVHRLKSDGYDFLEASRDTELWEDAKKRAQSAGVPITIAAMKIIINTLIIERVTKKS
jgi:hypothetical protein